LERFLEFDGDVLQLCDLSQRHVPRHRVRRQVVIEAFHLVVLDGLQQPGNSLAVELALVALSVLDSPQGVISFVTHAGAVSPSKNF
jgi:hypothetical protein